MESEWIIECYENQTYSINGKTYAKVRSNPLSNPTTSRQTTATAGDDGLRNYTMGIRKADGKVYVNYAEYMDHLTRTGFQEYENGFLGNPDYIPYHLTDDGEMILYDYTMKVGDTYRHVEGYEDVAVVEKDFVKLNDGEEHCRLTLSNGLVLVESLGCLNSKGLLLDYLNPATDNDWMSACLVWMMTGDNDYLYKDKSFIPYVEGIENVNAPERSWSGQSYDLQGRQVDSNYRGIVIRNGRKTLGCQD